MGLSPPCGVEPCRGKQLFKCLTPFVVITNHSKWMQSSSVAFCSSSEVQKTRKKQALLFLPTSDCFCRCTFINMGRYNCRSCLPARCVLSVQARHRNDMAKGGPPAIFSCQRSSSPSCVSTFIPVPETVATRTGLQS